MAQDTTSARQETAGYWSILWRNILKIFFIDLLGAGVVLCATSALVVLLFAVARCVWVLQFRPVAESLVLLATIYLAVILVTAMKRHYSVGIAIKPVLGPQPEVGSTKPAPIVDDAGISTTVS